MTLALEAEAYLAKARHPMEIAEKLQLGEEFLGFSPAGGEAVAMMI